MLSQEFALIIRKWDERCDRYEGLTANQIASYCFGCASPESVRRVGQVLTDYHVYFISKGAGHARRSYPNWERVRGEFPSLFIPGPGTGPGRSSYPALCAEDLRAAFESERRASREIYQRAPIRIRSGRVVPATRSDQHPIFEFVYHTLDESGPLSIPEGAPVLLRWPPLSSVRGTFLTHEPEKRKLFLTVDGPFDPSTREGTGRLEPAFEELITAVERAALEAVSAACSLGRRFLERPLVACQVQAAIGPPTSLDESQAIAFGRLVSRDFSFLWGPPGTGKTHTLGEVVTSMAGLGRRVLAISTANVAIDQLALQTLHAARREKLDLAGRPGAFFRFGRPRDPAVLREAMLFPDPQISAGIRRRLAEVREELRKSGLPEETRALLVREEQTLLHELSTLTKRYVGEARVVFATTVQAPVSSVFREVEPFDTLVVDEASMVPLAYLLANCLYARKAVIISGDFRQLGPVVLSNNDAAQRWLHTSPFDYHEIGASTEPSHPELSMLMCQRRMVPEISGCINGTFYAGRLQDGAPPEKARGRLAHPLPGRARLWLEVGEEDGSRTFRTPSGSRRNFATAKVAALTAFAALGSNPDIEVAVICPYRAQVRAILAALRPLELEEEDRRRLHVGTVHTFQGSERDVVIWDLVEAADEKIGRLFHDSTGDRLCNVAITRAKGKLVLVGDPLVFQFGRANERVKGLKRILFSHFGPGHRWPAREILRQIGLGN